MKSAKTAPPPYPDPPVHLSSRSAGLWRELGAAHAATTGRQVLLLVALEALDRVESARQAIDAEGLVAGGRTMRHAHPAARVEHNARVAFVAAWAQLGLAGSSDSLDLEGLL